MTEKLNFKSSREGGFWYFYYLKILNFKSLNWNFQNPPPPPILKFFESLNLYYKCKEDKYGAKTTIYIENLMQEYGDMVYRLAISRVKK